MKKTNRFANLTPEHAKRLRESKAFEIIGDCKEALDHILDALVSGYGEPFAVAERLLEASVPIQSALDAAIMIPEEDKK